MVEISEGDEVFQGAEEPTYEWVIPHTSGNLEKDSHSFFLVYLFNPMIEMAAELYDKVRSQAFSKVSHSHLSHRARRYGSSVRSE